MGKDLQKPQRQKSWVSLIQHRQFDTMFISASELRSSLKLLKLHECPLWSVKCYR